MRIGFISPTWPPRHGGAALYEHRLAAALLDRGCNVFAFTSTPEDLKRDNGRVPVERWGTAALERLWWQPTSARSLPNQLFRHYDFMSAATNWVRDKELDIALVGIPYQEAIQHHGRELYKQIKALGIKVGLFHHDISIKTLKFLFEEYKKNNKSWEQIAYEIEISLKKSLGDNKNILEFYYKIGSPMFFEPDFIISCSHWSDRFIDPNGRIPRIVLHPFLDPDHWRQPPPPDHALPTRDVLMINPQGRKGQQQMLNLVEDAAPDWNFRFLKGGWGDSYATFRPAVSRLEAFGKGRVELLDYVHDIRAAYRGSKLLFFPSIAEGYGMAAVEPMFMGTPVVSSNYPAVLEAVGEGALTLCPLHSNRTAWRDAVAEVIANPSPWKKQSLARASELECRQMQELDTLIDFLKRL
jgi:glycosyltransferase involved in cell wall biosynthesis